jgi:hypothetical protein
MLKNTVKQQIPMILIYEFSVQTPCLTNTDQPELRPTASAGTRDNVVI